MTNRIKLACATASCLAIALSGCGGSDDTAATAQPASPGQPEDVEVVTHNDVGGGSDVFTRQIIKFMYENDTIDKLWPVRNEPTGDSIGAMSYMVGKAGSDNVISQITPTWIVTPMTVSGGGVSLEDLTPIAGLSSEPIVVATRADSELNSLTDFVDAAKANPGELIQTGGSTTATDSLSGKVLQEETGAVWKFLSFEDGGSRISAILRGDADVMFGSPGDFTQQVEAGEMKVISVLGDTELSLFPDAATSASEGFELSGLPIQFRGIYGAPEMSDAAIDYYENSFESMLESAAWETYADENGLITDYKDSAEWGEYVVSQREVFADMLQDLGLRKDQ